MFSRPAGAPGLNRPTSSAQQIQHVPGAEPAGDVLIRGGEVGGQQERAASASPASIAASVASCAF